jgi:hypothetical protein
MTREENLKLDLNRKLDALAAKVMARAIYEFDHPPPPEAPPEPPPQPNLFGDGAIPTDRPRKTPRGRKPSPTANYRCLDD